MSSALSGSDHPYHRTVDTRRCHEDFRYPSEPPPHSSFSLGVGGGGLRERERTTGGKGG